MGLNFSNYTWNSDTIFPNWRNICTHFNMTLPFLGNAMWQTGPFPGLFSSSLPFNSIPSYTGGFIGDQFVPSTSTSTSYSTQTKFNKLYKTLDNYAKTLTGNDKTELENALKAFKDLEDKDKTTEKYDELLEIFEEHKTEIKNNALNDIEITPDKNPNLSDLTVSNLESKLATNDVLDIISTWNSNDTTKNSHILKAINDSDLPNKTDLAIKIHSALSSKTTKLENNGKISSKTKRELKNAKEEFNKYENDQLLNNADYQKAFNNLYRLCRLAEAEIAESKAIKKFDFLKDENPIEKGDVTSKVEADLRSEGITESSCKPSNNGSGTGSGSGTGTGTGSGGSNIPGAGSGSGSGSGTGTGAGSGGSNIPGAGSGSGSGSGTGTGAGTGGSNNSPNEPSNFPQ